MTTSLVLLPLVTFSNFLLRFWQKKKTFACSRKKKRFTCSEHENLFYFFGAFFIEAVFVEMKRLKSFFLSSMVVLAVINKTFFFEKVACSENEA